MASLARPTWRGHVMTGLGTDERRGAQPRPARTRFGVVDELTCCYDRASEPANVHVEVWLPGRLDRDAFHASVLAVLSARPRARARRVAGGRWRRRSHWEYPAVLDTDPVRASSWEDEASLSRQRAAFLSESAGLDAAPPLRFLLASGPDRDCVILNAHHAALDGMSCLGLLRAVAAQYGTEIGYGPHDWPGDVRHRGGASASAHRVPRQATAPAGAAADAPAPGRLGPIVRIAGKPDLAEHGPRPGYGACLVAWDGLPAAAGKLRLLGGTVNDLLIAAMMTTIRRWNDSNGGRAGRIRITMPVGDQTADGEPDAWGHLSRLTAVTARVPAGSAAGDLIGAVVRQTRYAKDHPGPQLDLPSRALAAAPLPVPVRSGLLRTVLRVAGPWFCDTSLVTNLGAVEPMWFGPRAAEQVWFSTSAHLPRGLSLGAVTVGGELRLTFRYRRALLGDAAASEFAGLYVSVLNEFTGSGTLP